MKYKKYIVFQFDCYYPNGGLNDITSSFDTLDEAKSYIRKRPWNFNEVADRDIWEIVFKEIY